MNLMKTRECTGQDKNRNPKWMRTCSNHLYSPKLCKNLKQGLQMIQKLLVHHLSNTKERIVTLSHETISVAQINNSSNNNYFYIDQQGKENDLQVYFVSSKNRESQLWSPFQERNGRVISLELLVTRLSSDLPSQSGTRPQVGRTETAILLSVVIHLSWKRFAVFPYYQVNSHRLLLRR